MQDVVRSPRNCYIYGMSYKELAIETLQAKGLRITQPRRLVVDILESATEALSAYDIKHRLDAAGAQVDTVSVYRILDCLEENHLIHRILSTGKVKKCQLDHHEDTCELHQADHCHHLLICQSCGHIEEVHCPGLPDIIKTLSQHTGFQIQRHNLEFFGQCQKCRDA